jgi:P-type conjugative transfer protein TrbJ
MFKPTSPATRRCALLGAASAAILMVTSFRPAAADLPVIDPTSIAGQALQLAKTAQSYIQQLQSYVTQVEQYKLEIQNTIQVPLQAYNQISGMAAQLQSMTSATSLLTGNSGGIIQSMSSLEGYADRLSSLGYGAENLGTQFQQWQTQLAGNAKTLGNVISTAQTQLASQASVTTTAQGSVASAAGQLQALQALGEVAASNNATLTTLSGVLVASAQAAQSDRLVAEDRQSLSDAAVKQMLTPDATAQAPGTNYDLFQ